MNLNQVTDTVTPTTGVMSIAGAVSTTSATIATGTTITPTTGNNQFDVTALATGATIAAPTGTAADGQKLIIRITDNGSAQTLTWTTSSGGYRIIGVTLPTTTTATKTTYVGCIYNSTASFWDVVAVTTQA